MDTRFTRHDIVLIGNYGDGDLKEVAHRYDVIIRESADGEKHAVPVVFQKGALNEPDSVPGLFHEDLIMIIYHRLMCMQRTKFACDANDRMIKACEDFMGACLGRRLDREFRGVNGTHQI